MAEVDQKQLIVQNMTGENTVTIRDVLVEQFGEKRVSKALQCAGSDREVELAFKQLDRLTNRAWRAVDITRADGPYAED